jgi:hypothetical protein
VLVTRPAAVAHAVEYFDSGAFLADLQRRVAFRTESGVAARRLDVLRYLEQEMVPAAHRLGATARVVDNPDSCGGPFLISAATPPAGPLPISPPHRYPRIRSISAGGRLWYGWVGSSSMPSHSGSKSGVRLGGI